jgi:hypothetical protein
MIHSPEGPRAQFYKLFKVTIPYNLATFQQQGFSLAGKAILKEEAYNRKHSTCNAPTSDAGKPKFAFSESLLWSS